MMTCFRCRYANISTWQGSHKWMTEAQVKHVAGRFKSRVLHYMYLYMHCFISGHQESEFQWQKFIILFDDYKSDLCHCIFLSKGPSECQSDFPYRYTHHGCSNNRNWWGVLLTNNQHWWGIPHQSGALVGHPHQCLLEASLNNDSQGQTTAETDIGAPQHLMHFQLSNT